MPLPTTSTSSKIPAGSCNHTKSIALLIRAANTSGAERNRSQPAAASAEPRGDARTEPLTRRDARSMSTRLFAGDSFAIFNDCSSLKRCDAACVPCASDAVDHRNPRACDQARSLALLFAMTMRMMAVMRKRSEVWVSAWRRSGQRQRGEGRGRTIREQTQLEMCTHTHALN